MEIDLGYRYTLALLAKLGPAAHDLVLAGGQAVNYWAEIYMERSELLRADAPFASKDVDFCGGADDARRCAALLHGRCTIPKLDDRSPCTGVVFHVDAGGREQRVDFLGVPFGLDAKEVRAMAIPFQEDTGGGLLELRVLHPVHVLESRACNVGGLPGYRAPNGLKQLRAAVVCAREFSRDLLDAGYVRDVLRLNERIFRFALREHGLGVWAHDGISVFDAVLRDPRLPLAFEQVRYPQMVQELDRGRSQHIARLRGAAAVGEPDGTDALRDESEHDRDGGRGGR